jgi:hypothetical protein
VTLLLCQSIASDNLWEQEEKRTEIKKEQIAIIRSFSIDESCKDLGFSNIACCFGEDHFRISRTFKKQNRKEGKKVYPIKN